jgi:hypothetical protein
MALFAKTKIETQGIYRMILARFRPLALNKFAMGMEPAVAIMKVAEPMMSPNFRLFS